jgi:hypothetical protein
MQQNVTICGLCPTENCTDLGLSGPGKQAPCVVVPSTPPPDAAALRPTLDLIVRLRAGVGADADGIVGDENPWHILQRCRRTASSFRKTKVTVSHGLPCRSARVHFRGGASPLQRQVTVPSLPKPMSFSVAASPPQDRQRSIAQRPGPHAPGSHIRRRRRGDGRSAQGHRDPANRESRLGHGVMLD